MYALIKPKLAKRGVGWTRIPKILVYKYLRSVSHYTIFAICFRRTPSVEPSVQTIDKLRLYSRFDCTKNKRNDLLKFITMRLLFSQMRVRTTVTRYSNFPNTSPVAFVVYKNVIPNGFSCYFAHFDSRPEQFSFNLSRDERRTVAATRVELTNVPIEMHYCCSQDDTGVRDDHIVDGALHTALVPGPVLGVQDVARGGKMQKLLVGQFVGRQQLRGRRTRGECDNDARSRTPRKRRTRHAGLSTAVRTSGARGVTARRGAQSRSRDESKSFDNRSS